SLHCPPLPLFSTSFVFFTAPSTSPFYTLSLHDALPISADLCNVQRFSTMAPRWPRAWWGGVVVDDLNGASPWGAMVCHSAAMGRSEERRVRKECRSRWWPEH